jgi:hypothetical protein
LIIDRFLRVQTQAAYKAGEENAKHHQKQRNRQSIARFPQTDRRKIEGRDVNGCIGTPHDD